MLEHTNIDFRRGGFVTHTSPKLDNAMPRRFSSDYFANTSATDTFRESQDWFHHERGNVIEMRTPRYSPSPSPRRQGLFDSPAGASPGAMRRCMSERGLVRQEKPASLLKRDEKPVSLFNRDEKPVSLFNRDEPFWTSPRTPRSWKADHPASAARGRSAETLLPLKMRELSPRDTLQDRPPAGRSKSPTFDVSEDWMAWSRPPDPVSPRHDRNMPSSNFQSPVRRMHSGKITRNSENWLRNVTDGQDAKPLPPMIANSENFQVSRGKKTGIYKDLDIAKHLVRFEADRVPAAPLSHRRHDFADHPQVVKQMEELRTLSPRRIAEAARADLASPGRHQSVAADFQHRTSGEMAAAVQPELSPSRAAGAEKYVVGYEIFDMENNGRRKTDLRKASIRHHSNSDVVKDHLQPSPYTSAIPGSKEEAARRVHVYGDFSVTPATMPKDTAYIHSGLKVVKYQTRSPGAFSPNARRVPALQMIRSPR